MILPFSEIETVAFVGSGKVANGLATIFHNAGFIITGISSRNKETGKALAQIVDAPFFDSQLELKADLILIAVADQHVSEIVKCFPAEQLVAFTAGSISLEAVNSNENRAVFYPLQTFTEGRNLSVNQIPILLETKLLEAANCLKLVCEKIGFQFQFCDSEKRKYLHLSAVFVNNFANHLVYLAKEESDKNMLDWRLFEPLLAETFEKLKFLSPFEAQTGPAKRNDTAIIEKHLKLLTGRKKEIYALLSKSITETFLTKGELTK